MLASQSQRSEELSELYYTNQKIERSDPNFRVIPSVVHRFRPNYPCLTGITPLGLGDVVGDNVRDGHQYACGLHAITGMPIVYSFGCYRRQDYEKSLLTHRPDAVISIFELLPHMLVPDYQRGNKHFPLPETLSYIARSADDDDPSSFFIHSYTDSRTNYPLLIYLSEQPTLPCTHLSIHL